MTSTSDRRRAEHHCHARHCGTHVPPEMLMCRSHWFMVPPEIRDRVWKHYRPGQCDDMNPSEEWHRAADEAIEAVAKAERIRCVRMHGPDCGCWNGEKRKTAGPAQGDLFK